MTTRSTKLWIGLGAFVLAAQAAEPASAAKLARAATVSPPGLGGDGLLLAQSSGGGECGEGAECATEGGEGGEGGEDGEGGEGGEGGEAGASADPLANDTAYLHQLGQIAGHLAVGVELYRAGEREAAATHMKHPGDELYATLEPALEARKAPAFDGELEQLAQKVESGAPQAEVEAAYAELRQRLEAAAEAAPGWSDPAVVLQAVQRLVRTAGEEYEEGVEGGRIVNPHEYQDALGFVRTAEEAVARLKQRGAGHPELFAKVERELEALDAALPGVVPPEQVSAEASLFHGAAARIEIALLSLEW